MSNYYLKVRGKQIPIKRLANIKGVNIVLLDSLESIDKVTLAYDNIDELTDEIIKLKRIDKNSSGETCVENLGSNEKLPLLFKDNLKLFDPNNLKHTKQKLKTLYDISNSKDFYQSLFFYIYPKKECRSFLTEFRSYLQQEDFYSNDFHDFKNILFNTLISDKPYNMYKELREFSLFMFSALGFEAIRIEEAEKRRKKKEDDEPPEQFTLWDL